jgi:hypothetical protein
VKTSVTELPESRVRVDAEVPAAEVEKRLVRAAKEVGRELKMPGFRKGKVPPPVVIRRVGRSALLEDAVRDGLSRWYVEAIDDAGVDPVGDPKLDLGDLPEEGKPLQFSIEVGVRPTAKLGTYKGLEVGRAEPEVPDASVDTELEGLRERLATLETVDEPAGKGDFVLVDFNGTVDGEEFAGGTARDELIELGSDRLVPGFEEQLEGARAGEERTVTIEFPDDYGAEELRGRTAEFAVAVKEVKRKDLPELDDDFAVDAAGFDSLQELRDDVRDRLREREEQRIASEFREAGPRRRDERGGDRRARLTGPRARARALPPDDALALAPGDLGGGLPARRGQGPRPARRRGQARRRARPPPRGRASPPWSRPRASSPTTRSSKRRSPPPPRARRRRRPSCSRGCARPVATPHSSATSPPAARSTSWPRRPSRSPVEQAKARDKLWTPERGPEKGSGQLWTPGS